MVLHDSRPLHICKLLAHCDVLYPSVRPSLARGGTCQFSYPYRFDHSPPTSERCLVLGCMSWPSARDWPASRSVSRVCGSRAGKLPLTVHALLTSLPPSQNVGRELCDNCDHSSRGSQLPSFCRIPSASSGTSSWIWRRLGDVTRCFKSPCSKAATSGGRRSTTNRRAKYWWFASLPCSTWRKAGTAPAPVETRRSATGRATGQFPSAIQAMRSSRNGAIAGKPAASSCVTASRSNLSSGNRILFPLRKASQSCTF
jgi:hypothetical protein